MTDPSALNLTDEERAELAHQRIEEPDEDAEERDPDAIEPSDVADGDIADDSGTLDETVMGTTTGSDE